MSEGLLVRDGKIAPVSCYYSYRVFLGASKRVRKKTWMLSSGALEKHRKSRGLNPIDDSTVGGRDKNCRVTLIDTGTTGYPRELGSLRLPDVKGSEKTTPHY
ncbi:uncharacterized [Tachysurus ichikawai]